jgi:hypothetical protein
MTAKTNHWHFCFPGNRNTTAKFAKSAKVPDRSGATRPSFVISTSDFDPTSSSSQALAETDVAASRGTYPDTC